MLEAGQSQKALAALGDAVADGITRVHGRLDPLLEDQALDGTQALDGNHPPDEHPAPADDPLSEEPGLPT